MILTYRTRFYNKKENDKILVKDLDIMDKLRDLLNIRIIAYQ